ncbi:hypothetical protein PIROE2DRAFT_59651 [Piromyces sp. E2]|nr:hypothetical protein PIROE2DRAFT_59651 [Piromyces sp. E2]|eukprot:OUM66002.1 hypothetical protein PIROE2DRAFT_59651 [Piromyces sp. E2]
MTSNQENENIRNESVSRKSSTDTIDFDTLRANSNNNQLDIVNENNNNNSDDEEEEEDEKGEDDIEKEIKNINNNIKKNQKDSVKGNGDGNTNDNEADNLLADEEKNKNEKKSDDVTTPTSSSTTPEKDTFTTTTTTTTTTATTATTADEKKEESNSSESEKNKNNDNVTTDMVESIKKEGDANNSKKEDMVEPLDDVDNIFSSERSVNNKKKRKNIDDYHSIIEYDDLEALPIKTIINPHHNCGVIAMKMSNDSKYLVTLGAGGEDGFIRIYDFQYRLYIWLEKINGGPVLSISFNKNRPGPSIVSSLNIPDFMILTKHAKILHIFNGEDEETTKRMVNINNNISMMNVKDSNVTINSILEKNGQKTQFGNTNATNNIENLNDPNNNSPNYDIDKFITISKFPQFKTILETQYDKISAIESHPLKPEIAVSGHSGLLQIYNYLTKELIVQRLFEYEEEKKDEKEKDKDKGGLTNLIKKKY